MELRNLKTFEAVCRWGSFTAAAEGLGYAQSSVTAQIKQLEQETGCVLFDRLGKTPTLTAQGAVLLDYAREVLSRTDEVLTRLADKEPAGLLRVGAFESVGAAFLPGVLSRVKRDWPGIELTVSTGDHQILDELLYNDRVDMVWTCETLQREDLHCLASFTHELAVVCAPDHPMAGKRVELEHLVAEPVILGEKSCQHSVLRTLEAAGLHPNVAFEITNAWIIRQMVAAGLGLGFLPLFLVESEIQRGNLKQIWVDGLEPTMWAQVAVHKNRTVTPATEAFARAVAEDEMVARYTVEKGPCR